MKRILHALPAPLALFALLVAAPALAQSKTGTTIGTFLEIEPSARIAAMGNAGTALDFGLTAAYYNPAAIARIAGTEFVFDHNLWIADIAYDHVAGALPLGKWGTGFAAVTSLNSGDMPVRTVAQPLGTGESFHVSDIAIALGIGKEVTDRFSAGVQVTYLQETVWHSSVASGTISVGTLFRTSERGFHLGACIQNFGTQAKYSGSDLQVTYDQDPSRSGDNGALPAQAFTDAFSVPVLFRVGGGMPFRLSQDATLNVAVDAYHPNDNPESMSAGAELSFRDQLAIRAGYQNAFMQDSEVGLTAGAGLQGKFDVYAYRFDYAWADQGRLGSSQRFSVGLHF